MAQLKQIAKAAQSTRADVGFPARAHAATMTLVPVSPLGRDQRATAVGEAGQHEQNTAAADTADDGERAALKRMALASNNYRIGKIPAMGSLSPLLSTSCVSAPMIRDSRILPTRSYTASSCGTQLSWISRHFIPIFAATAATIRVWLDCTPPIETRVSALLAIAS